MSWLVPFPGGKTHLAPLIVKYLPTHLCYVEPFGGSAAVLLEKQPSPVEVYNDLDGDLVNFFLVVREAGHYGPILQRLRGLCTHTPMAREVYDSWWAKWERGDKPSDPIERAAQWWFLHTCSVNGFSGWIHSPTENKADYWQLCVGRLEQGAKRLKRVQIEHQDFAYILEHYDRPETVFYLDPPYVQGSVSRVNSYYRGSPPMTIERHEELAMLLNRIQGKAIVSYYPSLLLEEWYPKPKWRWETKVVAKFSDGVTPGAEKQLGTELLLCNYEPLPLFQYKRLEADEGR